MSIFVVDGEIGQIKTTVLPRGSGRSRAIIRASFSDPLRGLQVAWPARPRIWRLDRSKGMGRSCPLSTAQPVQEDR